MDSQNKEITRTLQVLLWLWFGVFTSFVLVSVVNIAKLETRVEILENHIILFEKLNLEKNNHKLTELK